MFVISNSEIWAAQSMSKVLQKQYAQLYVHFNVILKKVNNKNPCLHIVAIINIFCVKQQQTVLCLSCTTWVTNNVCYT